MAGQRCALNLADLHREAVGRGDQVLDPALHLPTRRLDVRLRVLAGEPGPLRHWTPVHCHLGTAHVTGRVAVLEGEAIAPGAWGLAQLVLDADLAALRGGPLHPARPVRPPHPGRGPGPGPGAARPAAGAGPARLALLAALAEPDTLTAAARALDLAEQGLDLDRLARHWNLDEATAAAIAAPPRLRAGRGPGGPLLFARRHWQALQQRVIDALAEAHAEHPDQLGPDRERLRRDRLPGHGPDPSSPGCWRP